MIAPADEVEISVVLPCLNEADTIGTCGAKSVRAMEAASVSGEMIVADSGSVDGSQELARQNGARVVDVTERGFGNALRGGNSSASGRYILMADADDSYDLL